MRSHTSRTKMNYWHNSLGWGDVKRERKKEKKWKQSASSLTFQIFHWGIISSNYEICWLQMQICSKLLNRYSISWQLSCKNVLDINWGHKTQAEVNLEDTWSNHKWNQKYLDGFHMVSWCMTMCRICSGVHLHFPPVPNKN